MGYPGNTVNNDSPFVKSLMCNLYVPKGCLFKNKAERSRDTQSCTLKIRFAHQKFITKADSFKHTKSWRPHFFSRSSLNCHKMFCFSQWTLRLDCRDSLKVCWADEHHSKSIYMTVINGQLTNCTYSQTVMLFFEESSEKWFGLLLKIAPFLSRREQSNYYSPTVRW